MNIDIKKIANSDTREIGRERFSLPDMDNEINLKAKKIIASEANKMAFYSERPLPLGYYEDKKVMLIKAIPIIEEKTELGYVANVTNQYDGDTIYFKQSSIISDGMINYNDNDVSVADFIRLNTAVDSDLEKDRAFGIRFAGIDALEIPHYFLQDKYDDIEIFKLRYDVVKEEPLYIIDESVTYKDSDILEFIKNNDKYKQIKDNNFYNKIEKKYQYKIVSSSKSNKENSLKGLELKEEVHSMIIKANDIRIMIDCKTLNRRSGTSIDNGWAFDTKGLRYLGYDTYGQDNYKRFLGCIYLLVDKQWINLTKYLISKYDESYIEILPSLADDPMVDNKYNFLSTEFNLKSYSELNYKIIDNSVGSDELKKRNDLLSNLGYNTDELKKYTVILGGNIFLVPPTNINCSSIVVGEQRSPLIRSKGNVTTGGKKVEKIITMNMFFSCGSINGEDLKTTLPNGKEIIYSINGLRNLLSLFKFAPFMPIENDLINSTYNVDAVSLIDFTVGTVENYPNALSATITFQEFDWQTYVIASVDSNDSDKYYKNCFSEMIDYEMLTWYCNKPIVSGNSLSKLEVNSKDYLEKTVGGMTSLQPYDYSSSDFSMYIADRNHLDSLLQIKKISEKTTLKNRYKLDDSTEDFGKSIAKMISINNIIGYDLKESLNKLFEEDENGGSLCIEEKTVYFKSYNNTSLSKTIQTSSDTDGSAYVYSETADSYSVYKYIDDNFISIIRDKLSSAIDVIMYSEEFEKQDNGDIKVKMTFSLTPKNIPINIFKEQFLVNAGAEIGEKVEDFYSDDSIPIYIEATFKNSRGYLYTNGSYYFSESQPGYKFILLCAKSYLESNDEWLGFVSDSMQDDMLDKKQSIDVESWKTIKFNKICSFKPTNISCSYSNVMSRTSLAALDGYAPQYCGGQDAQISIRIITCDEDIVKILTSIPQLATQYVREYRDVLTSFPIRIDSSLSRTLGIHEVTLESVNSSTVVGHPGMHTVDLVMTSVDRTARNRESLKKVHQGSAGNSNDVNSFFSFDNRISEAEIYPDLELPLVKELVEAGFYSMQDNIYDNRVYPDPDFYFVYNNLLCNKILEKAVINFTSDEAIENTSFQLSDIYGSTISISPKEFEEEIITVESSNSIAEEIKNSQEYFLKQAEYAISFNKARNNFKNPLGSNEDIVTMFSKIDAKPVEISDNIQMIIKSKNSGDYANEIMDGVKESIIELIDNELESFSCNTDDVIDSIDRSDYFGYDELYSSVSDQSKEFAKILRSVLKFDESSINKVMLIEITMAVADTMSGLTKYEFENRKGDMWKARMFSGKGLDDAIIPISTINKSGVKSDASSISEAVKFGFSFGPFGCKTYTKDELLIIDPNINFSDFDGQPNDKRYFLDPFFRNDQLSVSDVNSLSINNINRKILLMTSPNYAVKSFYRELLVWIKILLTNDLLLSIYEYSSEDVIDAIDSVKNEGMNNDIDAEEMARRGNNEAVRWNDELKNLKEKHNDLENQLDNSSSLTDDEKKDIEDKLDQLGDDIEAVNKKNKDTAAQIKNLLIGSKGPLAVGRVIMPVMMYVTNGDRSLYSLLENRDVDKITHEIQLSQVEQDSNYILSNNFSKLIRALVAEKLIDQIEDIGSSDLVMATEYVSNIISEVVYLKASETPSQYIKHSFYDMVKTDKRGRMLRAFPTYYMVFIDEGREIGLWKLHDNFYNMSAISEIEIVKSRKIAADTARIVLNNQFKTYSSEDDDSEVKYDDVESLKSFQYTWKDVFSSIFSPRTYFLKEELDRLKQEPTEKVELTPGIRVHLRLGYGSDASELPIAFNGIITEVGNGESVELICQGDGAELSNPILETIDSEDTQFNDDFFVGKMFNSWITRGATPRTILGSLVASNNGWLKSEIKDYTNGRFFNNNPYGIVHFGDPDYKEIFNNSECIQNIYESKSGLSYKSNISNNLSEEYSLPEVPKLSVQMYGKSYWDMMHICANASPDFVTSIVPFGLRSSVFYGMNRYYYAYDYIKEPANIGMIDELKNRKKLLQSKDMLRSVEDIDAEILDINMHPDENGQIDSDAIDKLISIKEAIERQGIEDEVEDIDKKISNMSTDIIVKEKRKPFQQYHVYNSYSDIVSNTITATSETLKTCAIGLYNRQGILGSESLQRVGPMWIDWDIYPERQKTVTVDTQFVAKGVPVIGDVVPLLNKILDDTGNGTGYETAWRMTAAALKNSVKDMYQGELLVIGDGSIKPYDRLWITDIVERMNGCMEAEYVIHNFNAMTGFTTAIGVDCISTIDDKHEMIVNNVASNIAAKGTAVYMAAATLSYIFTRRSKPFMSIIEKMAGGAGELSSDAIDFILGFATKSEIEKNEVLMKADGIRKAIGFGGDLPKTRFERLKNSAARQSEKIDELYDALKNFNVIDLEVDDIIDSYYEILDSEKVISDEWIRESISELNLKDGGEELVEELYKTIDTSQYVQIRTKDGKMLANVNSTIDKAFGKEYRDKIIEFIDAESNKSDGTCDFNLLKNKVKELYSENGKVFDSDSLNDALDVLSKKTHIFHSSNEMENRVNDFKVLSKLSDTSDIDEMIDKYEINKFFGDELSEKMKNVDGVINISDSESLLELYTAGTSEDIERIEFLKEYNAMAKSDISDEIKEQFMKDNSKAIAELKRKIIECKKSAIANSSYDADDIRKLYSKISTSDSDQFKEIKKIFNSKLNGKDILDKDINDDIVIDIYEEFVKNSSLEEVQKTIGFKGNSSLQNLKNSIDDEAASKILKSFDDLNIINNKTEKTIDDATDLLSAYKDISKNVDEDDLLKIGLKIKNNDLIDELKSNTKLALKRSKAISNTLTKNSDDIISSIKKIKTLAKGGLAASLIGMVIEEAISVIITSCAYESLERKMKNLQVLQVFPIKKDGYVMTAGLNGSKGLVVGSPSESQSGTIESFLGDILDTTQGGLKSVLVSLFASEEMISIASKFRRRNGLPDIGEEGYSSSDRLVDITKKYASDVMKVRNYNYEYLAMLSSSNMLDNNIDSNNLEESFGKIYDNYKNMFISSLSSRDNLVSLAENSKIISNSNSNNIVIKHFHDYSEILEIDINGKVTFLNCIKIDESNEYTGQDMYDIPILQLNSIYLFNKIIDMLSEYKDMSKCPMLLESAIVIGSSGVESTGYSFKISFDNFSEYYDIELSDMLDSIISDDNGKNIFEYEISNDGDLCSILSYPTIEE